MVDYVEGPWQQIINPILALMGPSSVNRGDEIVVYDNWTNEGSIMIERPPGMDDSSSNGALEFLDYEKDSDGNNTGYRLKMGSNGAGGYLIRVSYPADVSYYDCEKWKRDYKQIRCPDGGHWVRATYYDDDDVPDFFYWAPPKSDLDVRYYDPGYGHDVILKGTDGIYYIHIQLSWVSDEHENCPAPTNWIEEIFAARREAIEQAIAEGSGITEWYGYCPKGMHFYPSHLYHDIWAPYYMNNQEWHDDFPEPEK